MRIMVRTSACAAPLVLHEDLIMLFVNIPIAGRGIGPEDGLWYGTPTLKSGWRGWRGRRGCKEEIQRTSELARVNALARTVRVSPLEIVRGLEKVG